MRKTFKQLRSMIDGLDPFMTSGHQIKKKQTKNRECPEWAKHDDQIRGLLSLVFPKLVRTPCRTAKDKERAVRQRERAGRWMRIIHLYYRSGMTYRDVAGEMEEKPETIHSTLRSIRRAAENRRPDGTGLYKKNIPHTKHLLEAPRET